MVATLYVARHGMRANADPPPTGIDGDPSLTDEGRQQAEELGRHVGNPQTLGDRITAIYSSPFYRCVETAVPASKAIGVPIYVERGLSEHYGPMRPTKPVPWTAPMTKSRFFPQVDEHYASQVAVSTAGETRAQLNERVARAVDAILEHATEHGHKTIIIFTHAAIKITIAEVLTGETVRAGTCSLDKLIRTEHPNFHWKLLIGGDTQFLSGGEQMHWSFEMAVEAGSAADEAARKNPKSLPQVTPNVSGISGSTEDPSVVTPSSAATALSGNSAFDKFLVSLDTSALALEDQPQTLDPDQMYFVNMETHRPIIQIGDKIYEGEWQRTVGTELFTSPEGQPVGTARTRIKLTKADIDLPQRDRRPLLERLKDLNN